VNFTKFEKLTFGFYNFSNKNMGVLLNFLLNVNLYLGHNLIKNLIYMSVCITFGSLNPIYWRNYQQNFKQINWFHSASINDKFYVPGFSKIITWIRNLKRWHVNHSYSVVNASQSHDVDNRHLYF